MNTYPPISVVILAAGKGTRMKSDRAKVLHEVFDKPMLHHVLEAVKPLRPDQTVVIVGHQEENVRESLRNYDVEIVRQEEQLGTGHAVQMTEGVVDDTDAVVMILCGDTPLISTSALKDMYTSHAASASDLSVMTTILDNPFGYGRILTVEGKLKAIVEEKEADERQKKIQEINAGMYLVGRDFLFEALKSVTPDNSQGEFYLTDIVEYCVNSGRRASTFLNERSQEVLGVNSRVELEAADTELQQRRNVELMRNGVSICNSASVRVSPGAVIGRDSTLMPNVQIVGNTTIGRFCTIGSGAILEDCRVGDQATVGAYSVLRNVEIAEKSYLEPMSIRGQKPGDREQKSEEGGQNI